MSNKIDREGFFRAVPKSWDVAEGKESQSKGIRLTFKITAMKEGEDWQDWTPYDFEASGVFWIIGKEGKIDIARVKRLGETIGWNGTFEMVADYLPVEVEVQIQVKLDTYGDKPEFRVDGIWDRDFVPGQKRLTADKAKTLDNTFGAQMRAILAGVKLATPRKPAMATVPADDNPPF